MPILTKSMKKFLLNETKQGYSNSVKSAYNRRIIEYAKRGIEDLTLLAQKLTEDQQAEIFTKEKLAPFLRVLFKHRFKPQMSKEELEKRRKRLLEICYDHLSYLGSEENAWSLAYKPMKVFTFKSHPTPVGLEAIYIASLGETE